MFDNFIIALNCVTPMFLTLCVGILLRASKIVPEEAFHHLSQISFHAFLPCLMFSNLYSATCPARTTPPSLSIWWPGWWSGSCCVPPCAISWSLICAAGGPISKAAIAPTSPWWACPWPSP